MAFKSRELAEEAFRGSKIEFAKFKELDQKLTPEQRILIGDPVVPSICVDGAWNTSTGIVEYRGVFTATREVLFREGPFEDGTNNIVEFLAIVHALMFCRKNDLNYPIYSDSRNAINWVSEKTTRTTHPRNEKNDKLFRMMERSVKLLEENDFPNRILKWETQVWGENPADFGRK